MLLFILLLCFSIKLIVKEKERQERIILAVGMIAIYLILALKKETVGIDISGYARQYAVSRNVAWGNYSYVYFEAGFVFLMKLFSEIGVSFQLFMALIYGFFCVTMYHFIRKYSRNVTLSLFILICYQFFVFACSGIRQNIAMSICLLAYMVRDRGGFWNVAAAFLITWLATKFHQSACVFFGVLLISLIQSRQINIVYYLIAVGLSFFARPYIWQIVDHSIREVGKSGMPELGGNFVFLVGITVFLYVTSLLILHKKQLRIHQRFRKEQELFDSFAVRIAFGAVICNIVFSGHSMLRASMYYTLFLIPGIPNAIQKYEFKINTLLNYATALFMIWLFYTDTLLPNQLEICPYLFFWQ